MFKVLMTDDPSPFANAIQRWFAEKCEWEVAESHDENYLTEQVAHCDALCSVWVWAKISQKVMEAGKKLKVIARFGVGTDNIDVDCATQRGIVVTNAPLYHLPSMPEHVIALMFALARNIAQADRSVRAGRWNHQEVLGTEVQGKTLGILGLGRIGSGLARKAVGLGMKVIAYDAYLTAEQIDLDGVGVVDFETVIAEADFLSVNVPLNDETRHLINADVLDRMKSSAYLINTSRGPVVDEEALYDALVGDEIAGAGLDVMGPEPPAKDHKLFGLDNVTITPHCGGSTAEAFERLGATAAKSVVDVLQGKTPQFVRNPEVLTKLNLK